MLAPAGPELELVYSNIGKSQRRVGDLSADRNEFLPISMPITAGKVSNFCDMACSLSSVPPASIRCWQGGSTAGPSHSDVPSQAHSARFPISTMTDREVLATMDRAEEKAGPKDVGEQALMRGLDTAFPFVRLGLSLV